MVGIADGHNVSNENTGQNGNAAIVTTLAEHVTALPDITTSSTDLSGIEWLQHWQNMSYNMTYAVI